MAKKKKKQGGGGGGAGRAMVFVVGATVLGAMSLMGLSMMVTSYQEQIAEAKKPEDTVMVIVASRDLYQGVSINEEDLYMVAIPPKHLPSNSYTTPDHVIGRTPRERILANEFVRGDRLADPESGEGLNGLIPRGMRAMSIELANGRALSGFLQPGNNVDLLVTITPDEGDGEVVTETILQTLYVLGVNSRAQGDSVEDVSERGKQKPSVTLLVTMEQAEQIAYAHTLGEITLTMRNDLDREAIDTEGSSMADLRRRMEVKKPIRTRGPKKKTETGTLTIIRGQDKEVRKTTTDGQIIRK